MAAEEVLPSHLVDWQSRGQYLILEGRRVFLREAGSGPPLLLLHAYPTASWGFHRVWSALVDRYRVVAPDLPGSGFSEKGRGQDYGLSAMAKVLEALLRERDLACPHLLAHGYASTIAQEMMARGQVFASACFITAGLFPRVAHRTVMQRLMLSPLGPLLANFAPNPFRQFSRRLSATFGPASQPSPEDLRAIWALLRYNGGQQAVSDVLCYLTQRRRQSDRLVAALQACRAPLLLIASPDDALSGTEEIAAWQEALPDAALAILPAGTGHYAPLECPDAVLQAYLAFRGTVSAGSALQGLR
ncbi:MAG: alpha/beta hydrolase [Kiloniellales bacterium]